MKSIILITFFIVLSFLPTKAQNEKGELKFEETIFDFGNILQKTGQNTTITHDFIVTNISKKPVRITKIETSCHCIVSKWTQTPIMPGKKGKITVEYDASISGTFLKYIEVYTEGIPEQKILFIQGSIEKYISITPPVKDKKSP